VGRTSFSVFTALEACNGALAVAAYPVAEPCAHHAHKRTSCWLSNQSGRQDSNLRPSAPKALKALFLTLGFLLYQCI